MSDKYIDEIHEIRRRQYEETKDMTPEEMDEYTNNKVKDILLELDKPYVPVDSQKQTVETGR